MDSINQLHGHVAMIPSHPSPPNPTGWYSSKAIPCLYNLITDIKILCIYNEIYGFFCIKV